MDDFDGTAFVAFADLCGFKELLREKRRAYDALNRMYNRVYDLAEQHHAVAALAVSDCVVAWTDAEKHNLDAMLSYLKNLHSHMLDGNFLMRTTVAKGLFKYEHRIELHNLTKGMIYGDAYVDAYLANDKEEVGSIIILDHNSLNDPSTFTPQHASLIQRKNQSQERGPWEFFWSVRQTDEIAGLKKARLKSHEAKFDSLVRAYKGEETARRSVARQGRAQ